MNPHALGIIFIFLLCGKLPLYSQVNSFPYSEGFESDLGNWTQGTGDDTDWTRNSGSTPSTDSGPSGGSGSTWYVYVEATANFPSRRAHLQNTFNFTGEFNPALTFDYHMYGNTMGELYVDVHDGAWTNGVWSVAGEQQTAETDNWITAYVDLSAYENRSDIIVRFRGVTGSNTNSDISIDNISVCTVNPGIASISTNIMCSSGTVDLDLTNQDGGASIQWQESTDNVVFSDISGATSANFTTASLATGNNFYYRAAVTNSCTNYSNTVSVVVESGSGTISSFPYLQDFESDQGTWTDATGDDFDWTRDSGGTNTNDTGPSAGNSGSTWYMYIEPTVGGGPPDNVPFESAILQNTFDFTSIRDPELTFFYHMFGPDIGALHVDVGADQSVFVISGGQHLSSESDWSKATVDLSSYGGRCNVTIGFRGITALDHGGDIAIDDVAVREACLSVNGGTASVSDEVLCSAGTVELSLIGQDGGAALQWQQSTDNINFTNISGATSPKVTTGSLSAGSIYYFRGEVTNVCSAYSDTVSVIVNSSGGGINSFPYLQDFESDQGSWTGDTGDDFDWTRNSGATTTLNTGPSSGNVSTWYMFTDASINFPRLKGFLQNDFDFTGIETPFLSFYYHMHGDEMGSLFVDVNGINEFSVSGEKQSADTNPWILATVDLSAYANQCNVTIRFRGETGAGVTFLSDMAIDDIAICSTKPGTATISDASLCSAGSVALSLDDYDDMGTIQWQESTDNVSFTNISGATSQNHSTGSLATGNTYFFRAAVTNGCTNHSNVVSVSVTSGGGESTFPYSEGFESATIGNWLETASNDFDWDVTDTDTPSSETGPVGANEGTYYIYTESSGTNSPGQNASIEQEFDFTSASEPVLSFYYHMYGLEIGTLNVAINDVTIWTRSGPQHTSSSDDWTQALIDLSDYAGDCSVTIRFHATTGPDSKGDMGLDDISICEKPVTSVITGNTDVCTSAGGETYSVTNNPGNIYTWLIDGGVQASGSNTNSITIDWGSIGKVGSVKVLERNGVCVGDTVSLDVNVHTIESSSISGSRLVTENTTGWLYAVDNTSGYSYAWTVTGGSQASGGSSNAITVNWGSAGPGEVSVIATSTTPTCPAAPSVSLPVTIYQKLTSNGTGGGDWNNTSTWACACIPLSTENVQILNGDVVTLTQAETINHMVIDAGGEVNNGSFTLSVDGNYTVNGSHSGTGIIQLCGTDTEIDGTGTISTSGDLQITTGNKTILSTSDLTKSSGDIDITGTNIGITNNGSITISGNLDAVDGTVTWTNSANSSLNVSGTLLGSGSLNASAPGNTVTYDVAGVQTIKLPNSSLYDNLVINSSGIKSLSGNIVIQNDLIITGTAQLDLTSSNFDIVIGGDWTNSSSNGDPFIQRSGSVIFNGSAGDQIITNTSNEAFYDLEIDKLAGNVMLASSSNIIVSNSLTLTNGLISPTSSETVTFNDDATATSTTTSYIAGKAIKIGNDAFVFPVGKNSFRGQIGISAPSVGSTFEAEYFDEPFSDRSTNGLGKASNIEYWNLDRTQGSDDVSVTLYWDSGTRSGIEDISGSDLVVAHYDGADWISEGGVYTGLVSSGTVTTSGPISSFSPFTFGSESNLNPLPVELTSFAGLATEHGIQLKWSTASEFNNDYFEIQRSKSGDLFNTVGKIDGSGTTNVPLNYHFMDESPFYGISFYRLKQVDFDGQFEIHRSIVIINETFFQGIIGHVYPNPATNSDVKFKLTTGDNHSLIQIKIFDQSGQLIFGYNYIPQNFKTINDLPLLLPVGLYNVVIRQGFNQIQQKLIIR